MPRPLSAMTGRIDREDPPDRRRYRSPLAFGTEPSGGEISARRSRGYPVWRFRPRESRGNGGCPEAQPAFQRALVVRSGCEALEFLRHRGLRCKPERRLPPVIALLDEDLSGMAGHSILRSMLKLPSRGEMVMFFWWGAAGSLPPAMVSRSRRVPGEALFVPKARDEPAVVGAPPPIPLFLSLRPRREKQHS